jgi:nucleotide-binding universal stress UspA family protein
MTHLIDRWTRALSVVMYKRILVPVDGSEASAQGLAEAIELAGQLQARIRLVHVVEPWIMATAEVGHIHQVADRIRSAGATLLKECQKKASNAGIEVEAELIETVGGSAGEYIVQNAKEAKADLIICGTHGRRGVRRLLMGSDAEYVVRNAPVPVLLVRHQGEAAREAA